MLLLRWTAPLCCVGYRYHSAWAAARCRGSTRICPGVDSTSYIRATAHHHQSSSSECRRAGSVLGPILFIMYTALTADVTCIVERHSLNVQQYADDTQLYGVCQLSNSASLCRDLIDCINSVASWMSANRLQLNAAKTEFMWCVVRTT